ncbi:MAG: sterol desaturase family protein [Rhodococcus sp.]|nr:sterol desaturase family protein [Rhodococcus sp. (in: high G+C Gram-positive bacteria)]
MSNSRRTSPQRSNRTRRRSMTLRDAASEFVRHPSPWMIGGLLVVALTLRVVVGNWQLTDLVVPVVMLAAFPFVEWVIHVCVLHWKPRHVLGLTVDSLLARKHREHHADPRDIPLIFIPWQTLVMLVPVLAVVAMFAFPRVGLGLTFVVTLSVFGLAYEWIHYLIHTDYTPKSHAYRAVWRNHRHHHYRNEHYWFTVTTSGTADRVLGTDPDPDATPKSPTARNLHAA